MAERRRIIPASVGPLFQPKEEKSWKPAVRFELTLDEPNDRKCTEFSYRELYKNAVGETSEEKSFNDLDEEDISGLAAFAKRFEEKYAATGGGKKKCRARLDDLMDVGMGYDETDPFVDNSECYDELVPSVLTTQLGGFYINQGQLNFREISDSEDDDFIHAAKSRKRKTPKKKRKSSFEEKERKKRKQEKKAKKQLQKQFGLKKKKSSSGSPTVAELLKRQQLHDTSNPKTSTSSGNLVNGNASAAANASKDADDALDNIDPSLDLGISDFKMDSDMAAVMEEALASIGDGDTLGGGSDDNGGSGSAFQDSGEQYVKCPANLPPELLSNVEKIKEAARKSAEGKCKFFTPSVNQLLLNADKTELIPYSLNGLPKHHVWPIQKLRIEMRSRDVTCGTRSQMYSHLASHLPCGKETLLKRAKKLRLGAQDAGIKEPLQKLREAIAKVMPENIQRYQEEYQAHAQEKANKMMEEKEKEKQEGKCSDEEEDDKKSRQGNFGPRKKFQWTDHIRKLLCDVVSIKVKMFEALKSRTHSAEEYIRSFLDMEVKPLWPQGWIQTRMLYKETRGVHGHLTSNQPVKPKKVVLSSKKPTVKKPNSEGAAVSQSPVSVAAMITQAIMSPNGNSNQSPSVSDKGTPSEHIPTLLDYANISPSVDSRNRTPSPLFKDTPPSKQSTPATTLPSSSYNEDSTKNAASLQRNSKSGVGDFTASFMEKLIADELAAPDKMLCPSQQSQSQTQQPRSQTPQASSQIQQTTSSQTQQTSSSQIRQPEAKLKTSLPGGQEQNAMSIAEIVAATAKAMETSVPKERQASSVLKQLSTHAQNNAPEIQTQAYATSKPVVMKKEAFGCMQERLKKLSVPEGKRTVVNVNIPKQSTQVTGPNKALAQTIQKLSSSLASSKLVATTVGVSATVSQPVAASVVTQASGSVLKHDISSSGVQKMQPVVRLTRPPTIEKIITSKPQVRMATNKVPPVRATTTIKVAPQLNPNLKTTAQTVRTVTTKKPARVSVQTMQKPLAESVNSQVQHLTPANLQAGMGNVFANLKESRYGSSAPVSSTELPYYTTTTSGKNSIPKTNQLVTHSYRQQQTSPSHPIHPSSYSPPTKVSKHQPLSASGSAFTAPSPPKPKPSTPPTLSPSTSPVAQKYPSYVTQRTSPNQTSPKFQAAYNPSMAAIPGYQQLSLADLTHKQATSGFTQGYPLSANQGQGSAAAGQSSGDAIITGPAPGTFFHQQAATGSILGPMQSPTDQPYQLPPWAQ